MVVAILLANQDETVVHLVEANARKCSFLSEVARETGAPVTIHNMRIEDLDPDNLETQPDVVTARALAPLAELLDCARPFLAAPARGLFLKGRNTQKELEKAWEIFAFDARVWPSCTDSDGRIVEITGVQPKDSE